MDADPGMGISPLTSAGNYDVYVSLSEANGNYIWRKSLGGTGSDESYGIAVDPKRSVYNL